MHFTLEQVFLDQVEDNEYPRDHPEKWSRNNVTKVQTILLPF